MTLVLVSGFYLPWVTIVAALFYGIARVLYMLPNRFIGFLFANVCLLILAGGAIWTCLKLA